MVHLVQTNADRSLMPPSMVVSPPEPHHRNQKMGNTRLTRRSRSKVLQLTESTGDGESRRRSGPGGGTSSMIPFVSGVYCVNGDHRWVPIVEHLQFGCLVVGICGRWPENAVNKGGGGCRATREEEGEERKKKEIMSVSRSFWFNSNWFSLIQRFGLIFARFAGFSLGFQVIRVVFEKSI
ncbi:hypothetical protein JCGZ_26631 [Jatropha curcas]|uniref:Uncharacterized protein n=1 Tax=Jatropha curcas TaxID=180498 RepID=A0A067JWG5_JATCU|nr:hypothetical protein JCGZ_26631 [Jatropha curcas]